MFGLFRTCLALLVVVGHLHGPFELGTYAVFGFYILSGYLMTTIMHESYGYSFSGKVKFAINRFLRIFPAYWTAILISILFLFLFGNKITDFKDTIYLPNNLEEWTRNIFLIFTPFSMPRLSPATWALTVEIFYYALICIGVSKYPRRTIYWIGLSSIYTILLLLEDPSNWTARYFPIPAASLPFSIGASIYHYKSFFKQALQASKISNASVWFCMICLNFLFFFLVDKTNNSNYLFTLGFYVNLVFMTLCITALLTEGVPFLGRKEDDLIGKFSYPIYLVHWQSGAVLNAIYFENAHNKFLTWNGFLFLVLSIILSIIISLLMILFVDNPIDKMRKKIRENLSSSK